MMLADEDRSPDVVVIGGGQAGLATGYFLRRTGLSFVILDGEPQPGGAWRHAWPSLRLFSPAQWSSLPGWPMPSTDETYPTREKVIDYLTLYEARYGLHVRRPVEVLGVEAEDERLTVRTDHGDWRARAVVSATGTWRAPFIPTYPDQHLFQGRQIHSAHYQGPEAFAGQRVLVIGGGNSGAQILAEVSQAAQTTWVTTQEPLFLPDDVDGRVLFERATARWKARETGEPQGPPPGGLGDIVMIPTVREARARGVLTTVRPFARFTADGVVWNDGTASRVDAVIWCTGFGPALNHLRPLGVINAEGRVAVEGARSTLEPRLWLVGYGEWTGFASATLVGVMRGARQTAQEIEAALEPGPDLDPAAVPPDDSAMTDARLTDFARGLPKAELHMHIEGSLEPELMFELAQRNGITLPYKSVEEIRAAYAFSNLQDFLDIYYQGAGVLITQDDFKDLALAYFRRLAADGGVHAEIFFDPQTHTDRGIAFDTVMLGLLAGMDEAEKTLGVTSKLILCFLRHLDEDSAFKTLEQAKPWLDRIVGVGLDSSEVGHPPAKFAQVFRAARELGLKVVAHAGEEGPPDYVWQAIDLIKVDRIDHGNRALEDVALTERLIKDGVTLTVCPLSNLKLCVVRDLKDHPMRRMLDLGLKATINSDDPAYFGGYLLDNYMATARAVGLTREDLVTLARNSFSGSFLDEAEKAARIASVEAYAAAN